MTESAVVDTPPDGALAPHLRRAGAHDPAGRRREVLAAARRLFAERGYAQTSIRSIAAESAVNQGLVMTYFGSKENLFMEVVGRFQIAETALEGDLEGLGARLAHIYMERWERMPADDPWPALVRSAYAHPASRDLLRTATEEQVFAPLTKILGDDAEARQRIAMVDCLITGMIMERHLLAKDLLRAIPAESFEIALAAALQHAITGAMPVAEASGSES